MKLRLNFFAFILLLGIIANLSCKKEMPCEGCATKNNKPPIAVAGPDQVITLPADSVLLDGKQSSDADGIISSYLWTKISGPASFNIIKPTDSITKVKTLVAGIYQFELKVTDNGGLSAKDTMKVIADAVLTTNHPPIANAGVDQTVTLPTNTINLDGSGSSDPDNNITIYAWTKISGPTSFNLLNSNAVQTQLTNLLQGIYQFELKVTDAGGLFSKDTMQLAVNPIINNNCFLSQTLIGSLSIPRGSVNILAAGNKILFAGGFTGPSGPPMYGASSRVDIYDASNNNWSTAELSLTRFAMGTTTLGDKIYFAGGHNGNLCSRVDIYDASNNNWSTAELSEPRQSVIAVAAGNKVLFAGGFNSNGGSTRVDIYDQANGSWSIATLSHPTAGSYPGYYAFAQSGVVSAGNKIYFMTGSNNIDVYDAQTNTWLTHIVSPNQLTQGRVVLLDNKIYFSGSDGSNTTPAYEYANTLEKYDISANNWSSVSMSQSRANMAAMAGDGKIFWAGGFDSSWVVNGEEHNRFLRNIEIYDVNTGLHSFHDLAPPDGSAWVMALKTNNKIFFYYGDYTEIYDINNHCWTRCGQIFSELALAVGNTIYQVGAGGSSVLKLEF